MATKTITITEEAYRRLRALKGADESFSDVIDRLTTDDVDPMTFAGSCAGPVPDVDAIAEAIDEELARSADDLAR